MFLHVFYRKVWILSKEYDTMEMKRNLCEQKGFDTWRWVFRRTSYSYSFTFSRCSFWLHTHALTSIDRFHFRFSTFPRIFPIYLFFSSVVTYSHDLWQFSKPVRIIQIFGLQYFIFHNSPWTFSPEVGVRSRRGKGCCRVNELLKKMPFFVK